jgi:glycosyltransferase involved in cell wall biosynthesis
LQKCLWAFCCQSFREFEVVIADDGSTGETRQLVADCARQAPFPLRHAWQENQGFRKAKILNQAIRMCGGDYLIFTDGDCLPRRDFVLAHRTHARQNYFITGGSHINIPESIHVAFSREDIEQQRVFRRDWLQSRGMDARKYRYRLTSHRWLAPVLDLLTPRPGVLVGCNSSAWKDAVLSVNGFDERYLGYGSEDKDLGVRLTHRGFRSRRLKYSLVCIHLDHPKTYTSEEVAENSRRLRQAKAEKLVRAARGIE